MGPDGPPPSAEPAPDVTVAPPPEARGRDRETATPARQIAPPTRVSAAGTSSRTAQDISTTIAGTTYVVAPIRLAEVRASANAHVVKASAVGNTPGRPC